MDKEEFDEWRTNPKTKEFVESYLTQPIQDATELLNANARRASLFWDQKAQIEYVRIMGMLEGLEKVRDVIKEGDA